MRKYMMIKEDHSKIPFGETFWTSKERNGMVEFWYDGDQYYFEVGEQVIPLDFEPGDEVEIVEVGGAMVGFRLGQRVTIVDFKFTPRQIKSGYIYAIKKDESALIGFAKQGCLKLVKPEEVERYKELRITDVENLLEEIDQCNEQLTTVRLEVEELHQKADTLRKRIRDKKERIIDIVGGL